MRISPIKKPIFKTFLLFCSVFFSVSTIAYADEMAITLDVKQGEKPVEIVGADIYANIDDRLTEITVSPDKLPFKWNFKAGALRIKSFWATEKQFSDDYTADK